MFKSVISHEYIFALLKNFSDCIILNLINVLSQGKTQERNIEHYIIVDKKNEENPNKSKEVTDEKKSVESRKSAGRSDLILNNHMVNLVVSNVE